MGRGLEMLLLPIWVGRMRGDSLTAVIIRLLSLLLFAVLVGVRFWLVLVVYI